MREFFTIVVAICVASLAGLGVGPFLNFAIQKPERPPSFDEDMWNAMYSRVPGGVWIGFFERLLLLLGFWLTAHIIIAGWLALKVAAKWKVWDVVIKVPDSPDPTWHTMRLYYGSWLLSRFLVGTLINVLIGAGAFYSGKHFWPFVAWLYTESIR